MEVGQYIKKGAEPNCKLLMPNELQKDMSNIIMKYLKLLIILIVIVWFGYSVYLNLKLNDYMRTQEFIQVRFPDETLVTISSYDQDKVIQDNITYHDEIICELKSDLKYLKLDYTKVTNEILYLESSKIYMLNTLKKMKDNLIEYLKNKQHINCEEIGIKIHEFRNKKNY